MLLLTSICEWTSFAGIDTDSVLSSAYNMYLKADEQYGRSLINIRNNRGPRTKPCETPWCTSSTLDETPLTTVHWDIWYKYDSNHCNVLPRIPSYCSLGSRILWLTESNVFYNKWKCRGLCYQSQWYHTGTEPDLWSHE